MLTDEKVMEYRNKLNDENYMKGAMEAMADNMIKGKPLQRNTKNATVNTLKTDVLNTCKYCKQFADLSRNRQRCGKFYCSIYEAKDCGKVSYLLIKIAELNKK